MKINLNLVPPPQSTSFTLFADPDFNLLKETKKVRVSFNKVTKTRISTSLQFGSYRVLINFAVEGVKTHSENKVNMLSGEHENKHYFVKSKKQDFEAYKQYVIEVVKKAMQYLHIELDELTIELENSYF